MKSNRHQPHVFVLPEDDANRYMANGFLLDPLISEQKIQILGVAGGWHEVLRRFAEEHVPEMQKFSGRFMVLLIDFDSDDKRLGYVKDKVPEKLRERVFVLGVWSEPEKIKRDLGIKYEDIGAKLAKECREGKNSTWGHELLRNNLGELDRLRKHVSPILFKSAAK